VAGDPDLVLRPPTVEDADECGRICFEAFRAIAEAHSFPPDFPSAEVGAQLMGWLISHPGFYGVVAERDGQVLGSNFLDERSTIAGLGPITVDPEAQNAGVGRALMIDALNRAAERGFAGTRLLQTAYHNRSLSLYSKLGFEIRELCVTMQGPPVEEEVPGFTVRTATESDLEACNRVCFRVHGHDRGGELADAIGQGSARVVEHGGTITGYTSATAFLGHSVGESNEEVKALIGSATAYEGPGILVPARNGELYRWCMSRGLRVVHVMTMMTIGLYNEPIGAYLPSVLY
jgi:GNAT superfamily N-acetyltransferase